jgi:hypothetical protein
MLCKIFIELATVQTNVVNIEIIYYYRKLLLQKKEEQFETDEIYTDSSAFLKVLLKHSNKTNKIC